MGASTYRLVDGLDELELSGTGGASPIIVISSEFTSPRARVVEQERLGISGRRDFTRLHDSSEFTATLKIQGAEGMSRYDYLEELKGFLAYNKRPYLYLQRDGWLDERRCLLRGDSMSVVVGRTSGQWLDVELRAVLPDGYIEDNEASTVTLRSGSRNLGIGYPLSYPFGYEPDDSANSSNLNLRGNDSAQPYIRIFGGCDDPEIILTTPDGETLTFATQALALPVGSYLDIDFTNRRIYLDGVVANSYYSKVDFSVSTWWTLEPGDNRLLFVSTNPTTGCYAEVSYRNTYLP